MKALCSAYLHKLKEKGLKAGMIGNKAKDEEIAMLIFQSGLSTSEKVTDVSGRGVGMDAVKGLIEEMGGTIKIRFTQPASKEGFRTFALILDLPLNQHGSKKRAA